MGQVYALLKADKPEAFVLGKGSYWEYVFNRGLGYKLWGLFTVGTPSMTIPVKIKSRNWLHSRLTNTPMVFSAEEIIDWIGGDKIYLIPVWQEIEDGEKFSDLRSLLKFDLSEYKDTSGSLAQW